MPKDTFFNLPEEKREKILVAALSEFENNDFDQASINQIVIRSEISKGSFYQYFEDKKDLYKYIINLMVQKKMTYITPVMANPLAHSFFDVIRDMNMSGLEFAKDNPQFIKIGNRLIKDSKHPIYTEIMGENSSQAIDAYAFLISKAIETGELRPDIDVALTARIIFKLSADLIESNSDFTSENWTVGLSDLLEKFMKLIAFGIKNQL
jgi:AcrR family transcriptional regulator